MSFLFCQQEEINKCLTGK